MQITAAMFERKPRQMLTCGLECTVVQSWGECWVRNAGSTTCGPLTLLWPTKWRLEVYQGKKAGLDFHISVIKKVIHMKTTWFKVSLYLILNCTCDIKSNFLATHILAKVEMNPFHQDLGMKKCNNIFFMNLFFMAGVQGYLSVGVQKFFLPSIVYSHNLSCMEIGKASMGHTYKTLHAGILLFFVCMQHYGICWNFLCIKADLQEIDG